MRHILLAAAVLAASPASAGQYLAPGPGGFRYAPPARGWLAPRGPYLNGYVRPYRPNPAPFIAGALLGAVLGPLPALRSPSLGPAAAVDAMDEIAPVNAQGVTRQEVEEAIADFCARNATASLCVKLQSR
jgi:hypothetical protein